ncbi:Universal stress family protein [Nitrosopumilus adriaticus]|uniref:Universal stress family protein n=1 Tax=Nitrosopumilus adriaticus TaxID=1580092 RepID=A0A0D5C1G3_9ARCH|nr:Universal stress family protein [Nitrosopumilus adriaticus]
MDGSKNPIRRDEVRYNIIKMAHVKEKFDMTVIGSRGRS